VTPASVCERCVPALVWGFLALVAAEESAPMSLPGGMMFASGMGGLDIPLTHSDLDEYERRLGNNSPTPMDAIRFTDLAMRVAKALSHKDNDVYRESVFQLKKTPSTRSEDEKRKIRQIILNLRTKLLSNNIDKVEEKRRVREDIYGLRVRLVSDPSKRGVVPVRVKGEWSMNTGNCIQFAVKFDNDSESSSTEKYVCTELQLLCVTCDDKDGKYRCSKCQREPYCSQECQEAAWATHKLSCRRFQPKKK
jgi:hypothetical protein